MTEKLHIIGGGMAGSEAAWQAAEAGVKVVIHEMRPKVATFAHRTGHFAEMVCSNSFRSDDDERNAVGLLHWEMRAARGLIMEMATTHRLPAGGALAVDRDPFAAAVTARLLAHPLISTTAEEVTELPRDGDVSRLQWFETPRCFAFHFANAYDDGDLTIIDKNGGLQNTSTYIGFARQQKLGVVILSNRGEQDATKVGRQILHALAQEMAEPLVEGAEPD